MHMMVGVLGFVVGAGAALLALATIKNRRGETSARTQEAQVEAISTPSEPQAAWRQALAEERCLQAEFDDFLSRHRERMERVRTDELRLRHAAFGGPP